MSRLVAEDELGSVMAWTARHGWTARWESGPLVLRAATYHPEGRLVEVTATLDGYRALPPLWRFVQPGTDESPRQAFPSPGQQPGISGSILHSNAVICAPWSRLAYGAHSGPHPEWELSAWQDVVGWTRALTLADMLDQIHLHLAVSPGFLA